MSDRVLRIGLPSFIVAVGAFVFGWLPAHGAASAADERTDAAMRLVDDLASEIEALSAVESTMEELVEERAIQQLAIPDDHGLADVIIDLQAVADGAGLELLDIVPTSILGSFDDTATPTGTASVVLAVAMRGTFAGTIEMLDRLTSLSRLFVVDAVAIGVDEVTGGLAIDLEIRVFTTKELVDFSDDFFDDFADDGSDDVEAG